MSPDDRWRLRHMVEAMEQARSFVQGRQRNDLDVDVMLRLALVQLVQIVLESFIDCTFRRTKEKSPLLFQ